MSYDVLVVKNPNNGYTARLLAWPAVVAHASTRSEAISKIEEAAISVLSDGEIIQIDVQQNQFGEQRNPWLDNFGLFKDDPIFDDWTAEIENYRKSVDSPKVHS